MTARWYLEQPLAVHGRPTQLKLEVLFGLEEFFSGPTAIGKPELIRLQCDWRFEGGPHMCAMCHVHRQFYEELWPRPLKLGSFLLGEDGEGRVECVAEHDLIVRLLHPSLPEPIVVPRMEI